LTLLEVAVALGILSIVLLPLANVFYGGESASAHNREYGDAIAIANGQLAQASGVTYANLGFYENQNPVWGTPPLTIPGFGGQPAVDLGASPPSGVLPEVQPTSQPQQVGTVVYKATNYVVWVNGSGSNACAYKKIYSVVSWIEGGQSVSVTQSVLVYPGGLGRYSGSQCLNYIVTTTGASKTITVASGGFPGVQVGMAVSGPNIAAGTTVAALSGVPLGTGNTLTLSQGATGSGNNSETVFFGSAPPGTNTTPDNVDNLAASVPTGTPGQSSVNLAWSAPVDIPGSFVAVWAPDPGGQGALATPDTTGTTGAWAPTGSTTGQAVLGTATTVTATGLSPNTAYWFEIVAFSTAGDQWAISQTWVTATTANNPVLACTLGALSVSQAGQASGTATVATSNGHLIQPITMTVTYAGQCTSVADPLTVKVASSGTDPGSPYPLTWGATEYTYNPGSGLCPSAAFITGTHTYTVYNNGTATSLIAQVLFSQDSQNAPAC
jgi:hypothetical protein